MPMIRPRRRFLALVKGYGTSGLINPDSTFGPEVARCRFLGQPPGSGLRQVPPRMFEENLNVRIPPEHNP